MIALRLSILAAIFAAATLPRTAAAEVLEPAPISVGLLVGEPISVTGLVALSDRFLLHAEIGPSTSSRIRVIAAVDVVYALPEVFGAAGDGVLFPWFGLGPRFAVLKQLQHGAIELSDTRDHFGFRMPFGISYLLPGGFEAFVQIAPGLSLVPSSLASLDGGVGIRVAF